MVSGPGGAASFLRRNLLGKGLNGPSLPLDVGQTDDIPVHLRRLVALRDQTCQYPGGCDQPASGCEAHHVQHRADGGRTSLANLKDYCSLEDLAGKRAVLPSVMSGYASLTWCGCGERGWRAVLSGSVTMIADAPQVPPVTAYYCKTLQ